MFPTTMGPVLMPIRVSSGDGAIFSSRNRMLSWSSIRFILTAARQARLEGVNKLYGTWILVSEDTKELVGDVIITRKLDRVRVVGKSVPIRLYQAIEEKGHMPEGVGPLLEVYHRALDHFEERRWTQAREGFEECLKLFPEDGPSLRYRKLAADYEKTPPAETWDGVFKMDSK